MSQEERFELDVSRLAPRTCIVDDANVELQQSACVGKRFWPTVPALPHFSSQRRNCTSPISSQAPVRAARTSVSPLLSATVDGLLIVAVMAYKPRRSRCMMLPRVTLSLSESPAQSESLNVDTEPPRALFAARNLNCNGSTVITPGLSCGYLSFDLMFFWFAPQVYTMMHSSLPTNCRCTRCSDCGSSSSSLS